jgi:type I restriction enzyme S subunit
LNTLPNGWARQRVAELGELKLGKMLDRAKNLGQPAKYLRNINVRWFRFDLSNLQELVATPEELQQLSVRDGDLFICEGGEPGRSAVWRGGAVELTYQKALHRFRSNGALLPELLMFQLKYLAEEGSLSNAFTGTTIKHLTRESLGRLEVLLPPITEQQRILDKLDVLLARVDACRERLYRVPTLLKQLRRAVLASATNGELTEEWRDAIAQDWPTVALSDVASDFSYGSAAKSAPEGQVPVIRMGNIQDGKLDWKDLAFTSEAAEIKKYRLTAGDVLFNRTNSPELVGKTAVYKGERPAVYAGYLIRVRCSERLLPDYLNYCLGSPAGRDYCWSVKSDGVSQSNINAKKLAAFELGLPPLGEQAEIVRRVEFLFALADAIEAKWQAARDRVERLTPALLGKAFRGELVSQDPNNEPAAVLLQRISTESATHAPVPKRKPQSRKPDLKPTFEQSLLDVIDLIEKEDFTFDELRGRTSRS